MIVYKAERNQFFCEAAKGAHENDCQFFVHNGILYELTVHYDGVKRATLQGLDGRSLGSTPWDEFKPPAKAAVDLCRNCRAPVD